MADPMAAPTPNAAERAWRAAVDKVLNGATLDVLMARTADGIPIAPLYAPAPVAGPGPWRARAEVAIVQRVDHPDPGVAAELARLDLDKGATGLALVGAGSGSAGGFGVAMADLPAWFAAIPLGSCSLRLDFAPHDQDAAVAALLTEADRMGVAVEALQLDLGLDPLGDPHAMCRSVEHWRGRGLAGPVVRADGRSVHAGGASEAQELAAVLAAAVAGLRALEPLGLDAARDAIGFALAADEDELLTIAKFRALRRLWAQVETACGLTPRPIAVHAETAWRSLARRDAHTNILRETLAAASAILGGADSLTVLPFTSALGLPDAFARRLARNTALVLLEEAHLGRVADPAAGAGAFEALTDTLARAAWALFQTIERQGGLMAAMACGWWSAEVGTTRQSRSAALSDGTVARVGVTRFVNPEDARPSVLMPTPGDERA